MNVRFISLLAVAVVGVVIVIVMMSVPQIRSIITYKETSCLITGKALEVIPGGDMTRGLLNVRLLGDFCLIQVEHPAIDIFPSCFQPLNLLTACNSGYI